MAYQTILSPSAAWALGRASYDDRLSLERCISTIAQDPYHPPLKRVPYVSPGHRLYVNAVTCNGWVIAYDLEDHEAVVVVVDAMRASPQAPGPQ